jgi:phytoene dehydrogenase-like protein
MLSMNVSSRTFSFYYPETRPGSDRWLIVSSTNANYRDWADLPEEEYQREKAQLSETTLDCLSQYVPRLRERLDWVEVSTPRTFRRYTRHLQGASFGTKFEGLKVSQKLPEQVSGLFHAGSVGIIMSGWLGAVNYGVIVSNEIDKYLTPAAAAV